MSNKFCKVWKLSSIIVAEDKMPQIKNSFLPVTDNVVDYTGVCTRDNGVAIPFQLGIGGAAEINHYMCIPDTKKLFQIFCVLQCFKGQGCLGVVKNNLDFGRLELGE